MSTADRGEPDPPPLEAARGTPGDVPATTDRGEPDPTPLLGLAHVASCSFLASRLAPSGAFWLALGGGIALARIGERHGLRAGYGASVAAVVQTVALIGPARVSGPLTQALNAPVVGHLQRRSRAVRLAACLAIRLVHYAILNGLFVVVVIGGTDAFVRTYDKIAGFTHVLPKGGVAAAAFTVGLALFWGLFFSVIQVLVYERALQRWPPGDGERPAWPAAPTGSGPRAGRRTWAALAAVLAAWVLLLAWLTWPVLATVAVALAVAWVASRSFPRKVIVLGAGLAALLAVGALVPAVLGAVDWDDAGRRAVRIVLLVLSATWARAVVGAPGLRIAARRALWRARRLPSAAEAASITGGLESDDRLGPAGRALIDELKDVEVAPLPMADALTTWVAAEAARYESP